VSIVSVFLQGAPNLELQTLEKSAFVQGLWQNRQGLLNSFQLLIPHQSAPVLSRRFANPELTIVSGVLEPFSQTTYPKMLSRWLGGHFSYGNAFSDHNFTRKTSG